ncbi:single-stranded DNA-binding protein [Halomonas elongata]|uniref:Single-stranded DNA-binding protein n=1 Tax=Halomonas elongata (strain ATCC 33173 / DSM 2581 / NBRC 15536 / NCIMB 2198 / 1H9) TaxID=768066 RepID=E1VA33_HALED|nr:single-stranded DNA-binding protein [Halomonas elongata]WBF17661.1 single-stranded DNA-binding protein [Halomonas elongata]WPU46501.1 single-stranded DNA-binding protein [Halomonas elongata DSM 2581]CBV43921.1 homolog to single-strand DNA-binding protein [Halomonas elongata DSM 2581]
MSTRFTNDGRIGTPPEVRMFASNGNQPPRGVLRLNVKFDNLVPTEDGPVDKGGFWANVEIFGRDVEQWANLYQPGMSVMVDGRMVRDTWQDQNGQEQAAFKVTNARVAILPYRIASVEMAPANNGAPASAQNAPAGEGAPATASSAPGHDGAPTSGHDTSSGQGASSSDAPSPGA